MGEIDTSLLTVGKTAMVFAHSNQLVGFQALVQEQARHDDVSERRRRARSTGSISSPRCCSAIYARTRHPEAAVKLVDFYVPARKPA